MIETHSAYLRRISSTVLVRILSSCVHHLSLSFCILCLALVLAVRGMHRVRVHRCGILQGTLHANASRCSLSLSLCLFSFLASPQSSLRQVQLYLSHSSQSLLFLLQVSISTLTLSTIFIHVGYAHVYCRRHSWFEVTFTPKTTKAT